MMGVKIERIHGWQATGVRYADPTKSGEDATIREMSAAAYVVEFMKVCGSSILEADFDEAMTQIGHVEILLSSILVRDEDDLEPLLRLQDPGTPAEPAGLPRQDLWRKLLLMDDDTTTNEEKNMVPENNEDTLQRECRTATGQRRWPDRDTREC
jgi:hypothetical protein